jgi:hypothetical protein
VHWTSFLPLLAGFFSTAAAAAEITARTIPGAYIVELADNEVGVQHG